MKVTILEVRQPLNDPSVNVRSHTDVAMVLSSRSKAMQAIADDPDMGGHDETWCFAVFEVEVDDPDFKPEDLRFFAFDGRECNSPDEAWEALRASRSAAAPGT